MPKMKKAKLYKKTSRKQNFKTFIKSGYADIPEFLKACRNDENLLIYTCLKPEELNDVISKIKQFSTLEEYIKEFLAKRSEASNEELQNIFDKMKSLDILDSQMKHLINDYSNMNEDELKEILAKLKNFNSLDAQISYLVANQPAMNETPERFEACVKSMAAYLKGYIEYNGYKLANAEGDAEDWAAEFWAKYCKICDFYRTRWFYPETLTKASTVVHSPLLYKEFIYIVRMSISGERKHLAFLATQDSNSSIFRTSLENKLDSEKDEDKTLGDIIPDLSNSSDAMLEDTNLSVILEKALELAKQYPDVAPYYNDIKTLYEIQDLEIYDKEKDMSIPLNKKAIQLGKIFLYKAGLVSPKILAFIKALSATYKARYNISAARVEAQLQKLQTSEKSVKIKPLQNMNVGWRELILHKRGEL